MLILALLLAVADPPAEERIFGDWAVACDNVKGCMATALTPSERLGEEPTQATIFREAGPDGAFGVDIAPPAPVKGEVRALVDGEEVGSTPHFESVFQRYGAEGAALAGKMIKGRELRLVATDGRVMGVVSLTGVAAALRYIDAEQGRVGTATALVATGDRPASAVPAAPAMPDIPVFRAPKQKAAPLSKALVEAMTRQGQCEGTESADGTGPEFRLLAPGTTLVLIPCGSGAYNFNSVAFVVRGGKAEPARFDFAPGWASPADDPAMLTNASWTDDFGILHHLEKARGLGDCGTRQTWAWDGERFRMLQADRLEECRGSIEWPTVYRANPVWR